MPEGRLSGSDELSALKYLSGKWCAELPGERDRAVAFELAMKVDQAEATEGAVDSPAASFPHEEESMSRAVRAVPNARCMAGDVCRQLFGVSQWKRSAVKAWSRYWIVEENFRRSL